MADDHHPAWFLWGSLLGPGEVPSKEVSLPLQGAERAALTIKHGAGRLQLASGAAEVNITIPEGVAALITTESGLAAVDIDQHRIPRDGNRYQSSDYASAKKRVNLQVETGLGSVQIR